MEKPRRNPQTLTAEQFEVFRTRLHGRGNLDQAAMTHSDDPDVLSRQSSTSDDLGDLAYEVKGYKAAMVHFSHELQYATRLESLRPGTLPAEKVLAIAHMKIGRVLDACGDLDAALREDRKALDIRLTFAKAHPGNTVIQRELAANHIELGVVYEDKKESTISDSSFTEGARGIEAAHTSRFAKPPVSSRYETGRGRSAQGCLKAAFRCL